MHKDLRELFPEEYESYFQNEIANENKEDIFGKFVITFSFISNIILLILKIIAYAFSRSMSILASTIDSAMDNLSGGILFLTSKLA